jgi:hypothetical protein
MQSHIAPSFQQHNPYGSEPQYGYGTPQRWQGNPSTGSVWILAFFPLSGLVNDLIAFAITGSFDWNPARFGLWLFSLLLFVAIAYQDSHALKERGFPKPFGWGWAFIPPVYIVGRGVVARIRSGRGLAPLFTWFGCWLASFPLSIIVAAIFISLGLI